MVLLGNILGLRCRVRHEYQLRDRCLGFMVPTTRRETGAGDSYSETLATRPVDGCDRDAFGTLLDGADRSHHGRASGAVVKPSPFHSQLPRNTTQIGAGSLNREGFYI